MQYDDGGRVPGDGGGGVRPSSLQLLPPPGTEVRDRTTPGVQEEAPPQGRRPPGADRGGRGQAARARRQDRRGSAGRAEEAAEAQGRSASGAPWS